MTTTQETWQARLDWVRGHLAAAERQMFAAGHPPITVVDPHRPPWTTLTQRTTVREVEALRRTLGELEQVLLTSNPFMPGHLVQMRLAGRLLREIADMYADVDRSGHGELWGRG
ncbi:hypothetical protein JNW90_29375 [Micromonospora sp. STR1s_5]|nr:hypothetical protein [Micromonospora sp. STR1s_5]